MRDGKPVPVRTGLSILASMDRNQAPVEITSRSRTAGQYPTEDLVLYEAGAASCHEVPIQIQFASLPRPTRAVAPSDSHAPDATQMLYKENMDPAHSDLTASADKRHHEFRTRAGSLFLSGHMKRDVHKVLSYDWERGRKGNSNRPRHTRELMLRDMRPTARNPSVSSVSVATRREETDMRREHRLGDLETYFHGESATPALPNRSISPPLLELDLSSIHLPFRPGDSRQQRRPRHPRNDTGSFEDYPDQRSLDLGSWSTDLGGCSLSSPSANSLASTLPLPLDTDAVKARGV